MVGRRCNPAGLNHSKFVKYGQNNEKNNSTYNVFMAEHKFGERRHFK